MLVCGSNVPPKANATGVLKFFDVYTSETSPELGMGEEGRLRVGRVEYRLELRYDTLLLIVLIVVMVVIVVIVG